MKRVQRSLALALFLLSVGGGAFYWVYARDLSRRDAVRAERAHGRRLFAFDPKDVVRGRLFARGTTLAFAREDAGWDLLSPVRTPADPQALEAAIERMATLTADPVDVSGRPEALMKTYGLDPAKAWMEVVTSSGTSTLFVGAENALDGRMFVTDGARQKVHRADPGFFWSLDRSLEAFREHRLLPVPRKALAEMTCTSPEGLEWRLRFDEASGRWKVHGREGDELDADEGEVHLLAVALTERLRAEHFLSEAVPRGGGPGLAAFGLERFHRRFELKTRSGAVTRARLGFFSETAATENARPVGWVEGTTSLVELPTWAPKDLTKSLDELRNRTVSRFERAQARRIELEGGGQRYVLERASAEAPWTLAPGPRAVREWIPAAILIAASRLKVDVVEREGATPEELASFELEPPRRRIRVVGEGEAVLADLRLGARTGESVLVTEAHSPIVGRTGPRLDDLFPEREANLLEPNPAQ